MPAYLSGCGFDACQIAADAKCVKKLSVHSRSAPWPLAEADLRIGVGDARRPYFLPIAFVECPHYFVIVLEPHAEDPPGSHRRRTVAAAETLYFPDERRSLFGPLPQQARFMRDVGSIRALPLWPIELVGVLVLVVFPSCRLV